MTTSCKLHNLDHTMKVLYTCNITDSSNLYKLMNGLLLSLGDTFWGCECEELDDETDMYMTSS